MKSLVTVRALAVAAALIAASAAVATDLASLPTGTGAAAYRAPGVAASARGVSLLRRQHSARPLSLPGLDGIVVSLAQWKGQVVLLNFWASWCGPCLNEIPDLVAVQDRYRTCGLTVVGVGIDEVRKLRNVARTLEMNYPIMVVDPDHGELLMKRWGNRDGIIPYSVLIDRGGRVASMHRGPLPRSDLDQLIRPLLAGKTRATPCG